MSWLLKVGYSQFELAKRLQEQGYSAQDAVRLISEFRDYADRHPRLTTDQQRQEFIEKLIRDAIADSPKQRENLDAVREGLNLMREERAWKDAISTPGSLVRHTSGFIGKVVVPAKDPVNGLGADGMVLVEHLYEGILVQRYYSSFSLSPGPKVKP